MDRQTVKMQMFAGWLVTALPELKEVEPARIWKEWQRFEKAINCLTAKPITQVMNELPPDNRLTRRQAD